MPSSEPLIEARNLGKKFCRHLRRSLWYGVADISADLVGISKDHSRLRPHEFWAARNISFSLHRGESLGLIGHNGAGKTTLLKLLNGLIKPDEGHVRVRGRVGALIALGAGFNPVLTARENIYINGSVLGYRKRELDSLLDAIVSFAEISDFIDTPIQNYSSGMQVRLGFAVAIHMEPDIMLVDEILAVGDTSFQRKCFERIYQMQESGISFIVVSHNPYHLERMCQKVALLQNGRLLGVQGGKEAVSAYHSLLSEQQQAGTRPSDGGLREGTGEIRFSEVALVDAEGQETQELHAMEAVRIRLTFDATSPCTDVRFRIEVCASTNVIVSVITTIGLTEHLTFSGRHRLSFGIDSCSLTGGLYYLNAFAVGRNVRLDGWPYATEFKVTLTEGRLFDLTSNAGIVVTEGCWELDDRRLEHP